MRRHRTGVGQYRASERHLLICDRMYQPGNGKRAVLYCHSVGNDATQAPLIGWFGHVVNHLADNGYPVLSCDLGGTATWGNSTGQSALTDARTYAGTLGATTTKVHLIATSMGAALALNWAKANPTLVQSITAAVPVVDMQDIHANNRGGQAASIASAWGGSAPSDANNPADNASSFTSIPTKLWYSTSDTTCIASTITTFASGASAETASLGAVGHNPVGTPEADVLAFIQENE